MKKKLERITIWENTLNWDWKWFSIGFCCDIKGKFYMIQLGFLHFMRCRVTMYVDEPKKNKKK